MHGTHGARVCQLREEAGERRLARELRERGPLRTAE